jgi:iron(III) transport system permease protein
MAKLAARRRARSLWLFLVGLTGLGIATLWLAEPRVGRLWLNTALLAAGACSLALPLGTLLAVAIFKTDVPGRRAALLLLVGMLFVPLYLITGAWDAGFGIQGWHTLATNPHLAHDPWLAGWRAAIWVHGLAAVPWVVVIVGAGLRAVEGEIEEDAATCASATKVLWHVTLPRAAAAVVVAGVWVAIVASVEISVTDFFQVRTFAEEVYTQGTLGTFDFGGEQGAGSGEYGLGLWSGLLISTMLALAAIATAGRLFADLADISHRRPWIWRLGRSRWPAAIALGCVMLILAGVPLANLAYKAGVEVTTTNSGRLRHWSVLKLVEQMGAAIGIDFRLKYARGDSTTRIAGDFLGELWLSTKIGSTAATAAVLIAVPLAWSMRPAIIRPRFEPSSAPAQPIRRTLNWPWIRLFILALCLTIPGPLIGIALIALLNQPADSPVSFLGWLYDSTFAPWLVQSLRALTLATLILWPAFASVPQVMLDAAASDGAGRIGQMLRIALPQRWPAVAAAWIVGFAIAFGELAGTILVMPPRAGATALSIQVFQLLHYGVDDRVAAICLVMVAGIASLTGIAAVLLQRK